MATINISKKKTKLLDEYYDNITLVKVYKCFCGKGKIIEENVPAVLFEHPQNPRTQLFLSKVL